MVLSHRTDTTADMVVDVLNRRGAPVFRCDTAEFPTRLQLAARPAGRSWRGTLASSRREVALEEISAVYYRRPTHFELDHMMSDAERAWAADEARHGFGGVISALACRWVNHPADNTAAAMKPVQLAAAGAVGLAVPDTLVTNDPDAAAAFLEEHPDGVVNKALSGSPGITGHALFTRAVTLADITATSVSATAHLLQARVKRDYEVRLTIANGRLFAARADAIPGCEMPLDGRAEPDAVTYTPIDVPCSIEDRVHRLMDRLRLRFGAADFIVTPDGEWLFLEINPNGQWGWIQHATGQPIAEAIADDLTEKDL
ncbi:ATP-grasp ribosomal peptide maturase [Catenuloplanes sp. NPDC051500]|uniref:ATP-grasp ribosomal peptide maturase n=1 Tax=Catenuloplanes sp. NPDC051500 TaxID=3363959 RepID=UPI00378DC74E